LFVIGLVLLYALSVIWFLFSCQYQHNRLPGKTRPQNDLLRVEWDVKLYIHSFTHCTVGIVRVKKKKKKIKMKNLEELEIRIDVSCELIMCSRIGL